MSLKAVFLFNIIIFTITFADPDVYWRPYYGTIPLDARYVFSGNTLIFIGRGPSGVDGALIGEIVSGKALTAASSHSQIKVIDRHLQIFCSASPGRLVWAPANSRTLNFIPGKVEAGYESLYNNVLYVGRTLHKGIHRIGKVPGNFTQPSQYFNKLYVADSTEGVLDYDNFEILVFQEH